MQAALAHPISAPRTVAMETPGLELEARETETPGSARRRYRSTAKEVPLLLRFRTGGGRAFPQTPPPRPGAYSRWGVGALCGSLRPGSGAIRRGADGGQDGGWGRSSQGSRALGERDSPSGGGKREVGGGVGGEVAGAVQGTATCGRKRGILRLGVRAIPPGLPILKAGGEQQLLPSLV